MPTTMHPRRRLASRPWRREPGLWLVVQGGELGLLLRGQGVLDLHQQTDVRPLHLPLHGEDLVELLQRDRLIHRRLSEQLRETLRLVLHSPLQLDGLVLEFLDRPRDDSSLIGAQPQLALVAHDQLRWEEMSFQGIRGHVLGGGVLWLSHVLLLLLRSGRHRPQGAREHQRSGEGCQVHEVLR